MRAEECTAKASDTTEQTGEPPTAPSPWCSINEACAYAGVSRRTIYNWIGRGRLAVGRTPGGAIRIRRDQLVREGE